MKSLIIAMAFLNIFIMGFSQNEDITLRQYSVNEGLSQSTVTCLSFDKEGILWIGTCAGLNRLIGKDLKSIPLHYNNLPISAIRNISSESNDTLLIGTDEGAFAFNIRSNRITHLLPSILKLNDKMLRVFSVGDFRLFASREGQVITENQLTKKQTLFNHQILEGSRDVCKLGEHLLWLSAPSGRPYFFDASKNQILPFEIPKVYPQSGYLSINATQGVGIILLLSDAIVIKWEKGNWEYFHLNNQIINPKAIVHSAALGTDKSIYVNYQNGGTFRFNGKLEILNEYSNFYLNSNHQSFNLHLPISILVQAAGNVFIGTDGNGLVRINPDIRKFKIIVPSQIIGQQLKNNFVTSIYFADNGTLYWGCLNSGLSAFNMINNVGNYFDKVENQIITSINFIAPLNQNQLLVSTNLGLFTFDKVQKLKMLKGKNFPLEFTHFCKIKDNEFVLGAESGIYLYKNNAIQKIESQEIDQITMIQQLESGTYLIAERGGDLYKMILNDSLTRFEKIEINSEFKTLSPVFSSFAKVSDKYFIASSFGLLVFDSLMHFQRIIGVSQGLPNNYIYSVFWGNDLQLWMSTMGGISSYNPISGKICNYSTEYGIQSREFNSHAAFQAKDGTLYFGGIMGLNYFNPKKLVRRIMHPRVFIDNIFINDLLQNSDSIFSLKIIKLPQNQSSILLQLKAVEYAFPENIKIEYYLQGFEKKWKIVDEIGNIRYSYLPSGNYNLMIRTRNAEGYYSIPKRIIQLEITPPFTQTPIFYALVIIGLIIIIAFIFYLLYLNNARKRLKELQFLREIEQVRLRISKEIHDDIGAGLTQISMISNQLTIEKSDAIDWQTQKLKKLNSLSNEIIQSMGEIVWLINPINDSVEKVFIYLRITVNRIIEESNFELEIDFPDEFPNFIVPSEVRRKLILITKEAVNNALKHSGGDTISLNLKWINKTTFQFCISDNGKGLSVIKNPLGNGLKNIVQHAQDVGLSCKWIEDNGCKICFEGSLKKISQKG